MVMAWMTPVLCGCLCSRKQPSQTQMLSIETLPHSLHAARRGFSIDEPPASSLDSRRSESVDGRLGLSRAGRAAHELKAMRNRQDYVGAEVAHGFLSSEEDEDTEFGMVEGSHYTPADSEKTSAPASWASRAFDSLVDRS